MNRDEIIKRLAFYYGIKPDIIASNGEKLPVSIRACKAFLTAMGINTDSREEMSSLLIKLEQQAWSRTLDTVQVVTKNKTISIKCNFSTLELHDKYVWQITEETGKVLEGEFIPGDLTAIGFKNFRKGGAYFRKELLLSVSLDTGYHTFKLFGQNGNHHEMKLIVAPAVCYLPESIITKKELWGLKVKFHNIKSQSLVRVADSSDLKHIIRNIYKNHASLIGIGAINLCIIRDKNGLNAYFPSSRMFFNTLYLNINEIIKFIEVKTVELAVLAEEYEEKLKKLQTENDSLDYIALFKLKLKTFKLLYQRFRESHLLKNTHKAQEFYEFVYHKGISLRKVAVFRALQEYFSAEDARITGWMDWPSPYQDPNSEEVIQFEKNNIELVEFYEFLQWQADLQLGSAGRMSFDRQFDIGIYAELPFCLDPNGAEVWANQQYFVTKRECKIVNGKETQGDESVYCPVILPFKIRDEGYSYLTEVLRPNMVHTGALKIGSLQGYENSSWIFDSNKQEDPINMGFPIDEVLGIIALESQRSKCMIVADNFSSYSRHLQEKLKQYGIIDEQTLNLKDVTSEEEIKDFLEKIESDIKWEPAETSETQGKPIGYTTPIPAATYRMQFNKDFTFNDAIELIPYIKELGISHFYASPMLKPKQGSSHGYDIVDHSEINTEAGSREEFYRLTDELHRNGMGMIFDIVPNHMGISAENEWWMDVLENGQASEYAQFFDIDWSPIKQEMNNKILVPVLGDHYGNILVSGVLTFKFNRDKGKITLNYYDNIFPINPSSYPTILEYRIDVLSSRIGDSHPDFLEYLSIITMFKNLAKHTETQHEKIKERIREKELAYQRFHNLCQRNQIIEDFIYENLRAFESKPDDRISWTRLHNLLEEQAYRLSYWRVSLDEINYRRFFDVNSLIGLRTENPTVFTRTHNFLLELIEQGKIDGLRIDHPDGLMDPTNYFKKLQIEIAKRKNIDFDPSEKKLLGNKNLPMYVIAEKILAPFEKVPASWAIHGTVGYEFLNNVSGLFIKKESEAKFTRIYSKFAGKNIDFAQLVVECKKLIMKTSLTGELNVLSNLLSKISELNFNTRDYTLNSLRDALTEIISHFPVYRTYISIEDKSEKSYDYIKWAVALARKQSLSTDPSIYDFIEKVLLVDFSPEEDKEYYQAIIEFSMKFQQYTGPLMAKGLEDTSFYRYNMLISLNEVGGEPNRFGISPSDFHMHNLNRLNSCPFNMLTTSTHDTKRSEDARTRISVLSEIPEQWQKAVTRWSNLNRLKKLRIENETMPDKNDEYLFYQILIAIWPTDEPTSADINSLTVRLEEYMLKAIKESKRHSSWINVNITYEEAVSSFIKRILGSYNKHPFWREFLPFQKQVALRGYINSLSQCVLKFTSPGIPDIYQGNELWQLKLVDPDNRKPVHYSKRKELLHRTQQIKNQLTDENKKSFQEKKDLLHSELLPLESGLIKMFYTHLTLQFRQSHKDLFEKSSYIPININGKYADNAVAFARVLENTAIIVIIPRLIYHMVSEKEVIPTGDTWADTHIIIPENLKNRKWKNLYTNESTDSIHTSFELKKALAILPIAILYSDESLL